MFFNVSFPGPRVEHFLVPVVAEVEDPILPSENGRVKFQGSLWSAKWHRVIPGAIAAPEEKVIVIGRVGITLLCVPLVISS